MTLLAVEEVRRFGLTPIVALLSHSSFGSSPAPQAELMRRARAILIEHDPNLIVEGEMRGDAALRQLRRHRNHERMLHAGAGAMGQHMAGAGARRSVEQTGYAEAFTDRDDDTFTCGRRFRRRHNTLREGEGG